MYTVVKSSERSEDSYYLGLGYNYRCAVIHIKAFKIALRFICFFELC